MEPDQISPKDKPSLHRALSLPLLTLYGLGVTLGAGLYVLVGATAALAGAFAPQQVHHRTSTFRAATKPDMTGDIDIGHAKYCADHFGECSLEEMENIRNGRY